MSGKAGLVGNGEARADLQSVLSKRKAVEDSSICHLEKTEMGDLGTYTATRSSSLLFWSKEAGLCKALFSS